MDRGIIYILQIQNEHNKSLSQRGFFHNEGVLNILVETL